MASLNKPILLPEAVRRVRLWLIVAALALASEPALAATWWWNSVTTGTWTNGNLWSSAATGGSTGTAPTNDTTTDVVVFNQTGTNGAVVSLLNQDQSIAGITVNNTGATTIRSSTSTTRMFTLGTSGITINSGAGAFTIGATGSAVDIAMAGSQSWTNNSSNTFTALGGISSSASGLQPLTIAGSGGTTLSGIVGNGSGTVALMKTGVGTLTMTAANTYTGTTNILGGTFQLGGASGGLMNTAAVNVAAGTLVVGDSTAATNNGVTNRVNPSAVLAIGGGGASATFQLNAAASGGTHTQTVAALAASRGFNTLTTNAATGTNTLTFTGAGGAGYSRSTGAFVNIATQAGFGVNFTTQPTGSGAVAGSGTDLVLVGAAINGNDFVGLTGSGPYATGTATYTPTSTTTWTAGKNMNVTGNLSPAAANVNSIRFADTTARTVTLSGTTVITSGMVMSASTNVANSGLTGGTLTSGNGTDLIVVDRRALGNSVRDTSPFNVQSVIADNGSTPIALTVVGNNAAAGVVSGAGQVQLGNSNNFSGGTTIAGGAVLIGNDLAFGTVPGVAQTNIRVINNGYIKTSAAVTLHANRGIDLGANGLLGFDGQGGTLTVNGQISGTGGIYGPANRGGTIILNGTNTFSGDLDINNGAVRAVDGVGLPSSVNLRMGSLVGATPGGYLETSGTFIRALGSSAGQVQWNNSIYAGSYVSGGFSAVNGPLVVALGGTASPQTFQWNSTSVNTSTILSLQNASATSTLTWLGPIDLNGGARQINNDGGFAATISGVISGNASSSLTKTGTGTLVLTATNTFGGTTTVSAGTLQIGSGGTTGALATSGTIAGSAGATLAFNRSNTAVSGTDFATVIGGAINLTQLGSGTLVLNGANTYTGTTRANAGTLQIGSNGTTGSLSTSSVITGSAGATLAFNRTNTIASGTDFASTIGGALNVAQIGSGTLVFSGANTYSGTTTLSAGSILLSNTNAVQNSTVAVVGGSLLFDASVTGNSFVLGGLSGTGGINLRNNAGTPASIALTAGGNNASKTYQGVITSDGTGSSTVTKQGSGTLTLDPGAGQSSSVGAFAVRNGGVRLASGTLALTSSLSVGGGTAPTFTLDGGQLLTSSASPWIGGDFGGRGTFTLTSGTWTNTGSFISIKYGVTGDGSVMNVNGGLVDSAQIQLGQNGGTSTLNLNGGVVAVDYLFNTNLPTSVLNLNGGILRAKSTQSNFINLTSGSTSTVNVLAGGAIIDTNSFDSTILMPLLSGTANDGGLTKQGGGTLTLSATNTFTGATSISGGTLAFDRIAALATTSGITIGSGAGLTYTGAAGGLDRNVAVSSGTGTVRNTGGGMLTLSGTLTKNGSVLRFNTGTFTVSGLITGANANSDLVVDAATVTLTNSNNDYNGPTFVQNGGALILGANNVISSTSAVTVDASTLTVGGFTDTIQSLTTAGNATINITASGGSSGGLTMGSLTLGAGTDTLGLTMTSPTAGRYTLLTYTGSRSGTFDSVTGLNSNYNVVYGGASNSSIDLQMKASIGTVSATTANTRIIVGGSTAISYTVANASPTDAATLYFQSGSNSLTVTGSSSGSALANQTSTAVSGLTFTSSTVGLGQTGSFTVTDPNAITTTGNGSVTVDVLNHSLASFAGINVSSRTLDFGSFDASTSTWSGGDGGSGTIGYSLFNIALGGFTNAQTAGLDLYDWSFTGDAIFAPGLSQFQNLVSGSSNAFSASIASPGSLAEGSYTATYTLRFRDQSLPGATNTRDLTLTMSVIVVPEPTAWLAGLTGSALTALHLRRRRRSLPADDRT